MCIKLTNRYLILSTFTLVCIYAEYIRLITVILPDDLMFIIHWYGLFLALEIYFSGLESTCMQITFAMLLVLLFSDFQSPVNLLSSTLLTVNTSKASSHCESDTPLDKTSSEIVDCIFLGSNNSLRHKQVSFCSPWAIPPPVVFYILF